MGFSTRLSWYVSVYNMGFSTRLSWYVSVYHLGFSTKLSWYIFFFFWSLIQWCLSNLTNTFKLHRDRQTWFGGGWEVKRLNRIRTDNKIAIWQRTCNLQSITQRTKDRAHESWYNRDWTQVLQNSKTFLIQYWRPSCYACYKPRDKSWIRRGRNSFRDRTNLN